MKQKSTAAHILIHVLFVIGFALSPVIGHCDGHEDALFKERIEMQCGLHRVAISCGKAKQKDRIDTSDARICVHNTLSFMDAKGKVFTPDEPKNAIQLGNKGNSPNSMGCGKGKDGKYYVRVRFEGCPGVSCEMFDLFSETGKRLTVNGIGLRKMVSNNSIKFSSTDEQVIETLSVQHEIDQIQKFHNFKK